MEASRQALRRYNKFPQPLITVVGRVTDAAEVEPRAVVQNAARVRVGAESPLAVVFTHSGISDAAEWQVMDDWVQGALIDRRIPRRRRVQDLLDYRLILGEHVQTE